MKNYIKYRGKGILILAVMALVVGITMGGFRVSGNTEYVYNGFTDEFLTENDNFIFTKTEPMQIIHKATGNVYDLDLNIFSKDIEKPCFYDGKNTYFIEKNIEGTEVGYSIVCYDSHFNKKMISKEVFYKQNHKEMLGLIVQNGISGKAMLQNITPSQIVAYRDKIYLYENDRIVEKSRQGSKNIYEGKTASNSFSYCDGRLYFCANDFSLYVYNIEKETLDKIEEVVPYNFVVCTEGIIFSDLENDGRLSIYDEESKKKTVISQLEVGGYDVDGNELYFVTCDGEYCVYDIYKRTIRILCIDEFSSTINKISGKNEIYIATDGISGELELKKILF